MSRQFRSRGGRPPILTCNAETIEKFYQFGRRALSIRKCAAELGVHRQTVYDFLMRCPEAANAYTRGNDDARRENPETPIVPLIRPSPPKRGEICPVCGQRAGDNEEAITLSPATIAEAQRTLDAIIARHLAAGVHHGDREE